MLKESQRKVKGKSKESITNVSTLEGHTIAKPKLFRISTVPMSLNLLLKGQLNFLNQDFDVTAISGEGADLELVKEREGVKTHPIEMHRHISLKQDLASLWKLYRYFKKEKPDIIHSITPKAGLLSMLAGLLAGVPIRMHTFTGLIFPHREGYMKHTLIMMDKLLCKCATNVYPEGNGVKQDLIKHKITKKPLKVIAHGNINGIDLEEYNPSHFTDEFKRLTRQKYGIDDEDFVFLFVGRLVIDKGLRELVSAFNHLSKKTPHIKLVLVGPRENEKSTKKKKMFSVIENNPNILEIGYQQEVRPFYAISDVFVLPSYREGFPNAVIQAGAMELPSIVTNISGCNEIIKDYKNGIIVPKKDKKILEGAMHALIQVPELRKNLKQNTRQIISQYFDKNIVWREIEKEYEHLLKQKKPK